MSFKRISPRSIAPFLYAPQVARGFSARTMATTSKETKKEFLCILPDKPNVLELRKKVKGGHYEGIQPLIADGKLVDGGAIFEQHPEEGKDAKFLGSVVVYKGENIDEVRKIIQKDIYATSGVWDLANLKIYPYVPAVRKPI